MAQEKKLNKYEQMTDDELALFIQNTENEIEALIQSANNAENELFWRKNPDMRPHWNDEDNNIKPKKPWTLNNSKQLSKIYLITQMCLLLS